MRPRCHGAKTPGHFTSFECALDDGHAGFCQPYVAPTVDEWRVLKARADAMTELAEIRFRMNVERMETIGGLHYELDALRAILASGCDDLRGLAGKVGA